MDNELLILLIISLIATGCTSGSSGGKGLSIEGISVEPTEVVGQGSTVSASLSAANYGSLPGTVKVGNDGKNVLVNYCPDIFEVKNFSGYSSRKTATDTSYKLGEGESISLNWKLKQKEERTIPRDGYSCDLGFELPFDYSANAFKQIQVKKDREIEGAEELTTKVSEGPLNINMEVIGSTAEQPNTILEGDSASIYINIQNGQETDTSATGLIELTNLEFNTTGDIDIPDNCASNVVLEVGGEETYRCDINYGDFATSSIRGSIEASINYTYVKEVGSETVEVKRLGN